MRSTKNPVASIDVIIILSYYHTEITFEVFNYRRYKMKNKISNLKSLKVENASAKVSQFLVLN